MADSKCCVCWVASWAGDSALGASNTSRNMGDTLPSFGDDSTLSPDASGTPKKPMVEILVDDGW